MENECLLCGNISNQSTLCSKCRYLEDLQQEAVRNNGPHGCLHSRTKWYCRICHFESYLTNNIVRRMGKALKKFGVQPRFEYLGCDIQTYIVYIESLWQTGMSWSNYGFSSKCWCFDHKLPFRFQDYTLEETIRLCHFINTQPMWCPDNNKKSNIRSEMKFIEIPVIPYTIIPCRVKYASKEIRLKAQAERYRQLYILNKEKRQAYAKEYAKKCKDQQKINYDNFIFKKKQETLGQFLIALKPYVDVTGNPLDQVDSQSLWGLTGFTSNQMRIPLQTLGCVKVRIYNPDLWGTSVINGWSGLRVK